MSTIDLTIIPATVTIENVSSRVKCVQLYKANTVLQLAAGDIVKFYVDNSNELAYFLSLASTELTVEATAVSA